MTPAEILDKAADVIERNGWVQQEYYDWPAPCVAVTNPQECAVCPRGGIAVAAGRHPEFVSSWPDYCPSIEELATESDERTASAEDLDALAEISTAERAFAAHLRKIDPWRSASLIDRAFIESWNDEEGRTADEVVAQLRACAANLRAAVTS